MELVRQSISYGWSKRCPDVCRFANESCNWISRRGLSPLCVDALFLRHKATLAPWMIGAIAGPVQFWFVHWYMTLRTGLAPGQPIFPHNWLWLPTLAFALPAAIGVL